MFIKAESSNFRYISVEEQQALLSSDKSIVIKPTEKGSGVVVWDREDYLKEPENHLCDSSVYESCEGKPLKELQKRISELVNNMKDKMEIEDLKLWSMFLI